MVAYKLVRKMKDGSLASLFINRKARIPVGEWIRSEDHKTKGYAHRPGWHCCLTPEAPHLSKKGRVWVMVEVDSFETIDRPETQGGVWVLARLMKVIEEI